MTFEEKVRLLGQTPLTTKEVRYGNSVSIQGYLLGRPKVIKSTFKGQEVESISMWVHQITVNGYYYNDKDFYVIVYSKSAMETLKKLDHVALLNIVGMLSWNNKKQTIQVQGEVIDVALETDITLD